ncbi:hypothetical protein X777_02671 [Ooceraea biroi]|uniref:Uncharacterized protein n=1 Tax=Ooceraea biroi TaxID=2015173 RepID=A0A026WLA5_OOCBI|nr:hypothetical protein X777_02671 [Ooceraea biroi]
MGKMAGRTAIASTFYSTSTRIDILKVLASLLIILSIRIVQASFFVRNLGPLRGILSGSTKFFRVPFPSALVVLLNSQAGDHSYPHQIKSSIDKP